MVCCIGVSSLVWCLIACFACLSVDVIWLFDLSAVIMLAFVV